MRAAPWRRHCWRRRKMQARRTYDHRHRVMLEETNLLGNVYFSNYFLWQGHCREAFLLDHAPGVMRALRGDFAMITTDSSCDFFAELFAGDTVEVRMALAEQSATKVTMRFDYYRIQAPRPSSWRGAGRASPARGGSTAEQNRWTFPPNSGKRCGRTPGW